MGTRVRTEIAELDPGYAALIMATGIMSTGLAQFGWGALSQALLVVTVAESVLLFLAYLWRVTAYHSRALDDAMDPSRAFGYFSLVAAANVVGLRLAEAHHPLATLILGAVSGVAWLVLTYAIPSFVLIGPRRSGPVLPLVNGSWFMWVVATESLAIAASTLGVSFPGLAADMAALAVGFFGIGVLLYLMLVGLVTLRLLDVEVNAHAFSPNYWIYMGATAITVLAGAGILTLPARLTVLAATRQVVSGLTFLLWAFGTWWVPLLLAFGVWRHLARREPVGYHATLWSMVFPLGMYAVASDSYGRVSRLGFMVGIARVAIWVALAVWVAVFLATVLSFVSRRSGAHEVS